MHLPTIFRKELCRYQEPEYVFLRAPSPSWVIGCLVSLGKTDSNTPSCDVLVLGEGAYTKREKQRSTKNKDGNPESLP